MANSAHFQSCQSAKHLNKYGLENPMKHAKYGGFRGFFYTTQVSQFCLRRSPESDVRLLWIISTIVHVVYSKPITS